MGVLGEFLLISLVTTAGVLIATIPLLPFPGTVTGMLIMLILLLTNIIKVKQISRASDFFSSFLPLFFIPLIVNITSEQELLSRYGIKLLIVIIPTTITTLIATGLTAKLLLYLTEKKRNKAGEGDG
ncbi:MAG: CidA/LrgA family protein [Spirochaetales bacterium]|nr:CidA/LrgA family protein [Spirochaetales bacterium]